MHDLVNARAFKLGPLVVSIAELRERERIVAAFLGLDSELAA